MRIVNTDPHTTVLSHEGATYEAHGGVFEVPEHVAHNLLGFPHWLREHEAEHLKAAAAAAAAVDPGQMAARLAMLEHTQQLAAAEAAARIAALEAENAALKGSASAPQPDANPAPAPDGAAQPEMTRQQKAAATRAANKAAAEAAAAADPAAPTA